MTPKLGRRDELENLAKETFGTYNTSMSASQFSTLVEIVHKLAPSCDLGKHQCYWFPFIDRQG
jgi:hypothetical protein